MIIESSDGSHPGVASIGRILRFDNFMPFLVGQVVVQGSARLSKWLAAVALLGRPGRKDVRKGQFNANYSANITNTAQ